MRYRLIKRVIDKAYNAIVGVHKEVVAETLKNEIGFIGSQSKVMSPFMISHPENLSIGNNTYICEGSRIDIFAKNAGKWHIRIGENCYISYNLSIIAGAEVTISDNVLIASNVLITSHNHGINPEDDRNYIHQELKCRPVFIGEGCWIGEKAIIMPGVTIGKKCVVAAGAVVTKDVPDYSIAGGIPAQVIKQYDLVDHAWIYRK